MNRRTLAVLALLAVLFLAACSTDTGPEAPADSGALDPHTEQVVDAMWADLTDGQRADLCEQVAEVGADESGRILARDHGELDADTVAEVLTDYCL